MIVHKGFFHKSLRILKDKNNKCSTIAGTFNTTSIMELNLKLLELNHFVDVYVKCCLTDKLLNYNLFLGRDMIHELSRIFNFENKTITWEEVLI